MKKEYKSMDQLPAVLNAEEVALFLRISRANAYGLFHRKDFPTITIGKRMVVIKEQFLKWLDQQSQGS